MDLNVQNLNFSNFGNDARWDTNLLSLLFGSYLNSLILVSGTIDVDEDVPILTNSKFTFAVYPHLNRRDMGNFAWPSWKLLWKLNAAPKTKFFLWLVLHGKVYNFLHALSLGPASHCIIWTRLGKCRATFQFLSLIKKLFEIWLGS